MLRAAPLVLDSQRSTTPQRTAAPRLLCPEPRKVWVESLFQLVTVPCKTWGCVVCGPRKSRELARVLANDAIESKCPPRYAITLTTVDPETPAEVYRHASQNVWRRLRRVYGLVHYFGFIEFTTGLGTLSGGHRRIHGHYLVKFEDLEPDVLDCERIVRETWESITGAYKVEVAQLITPSAAINYLSLHHQKPQQAPPKSWRGMRSRPSRGYFDGPVWKLRERARQELAIEAIAWANGLEPIEAALVYHFPTVHDYFEEDDE